MRRLDSIWHCSSHAVRLLTWGPPSKSKVAGQPTWSTLPPTFVMLIAPRTNFRGMCPWFGIRQVLTIYSEGRWPISFIGEVEGTRYSYTPRSDFLFLLNKFPFLFFEICSDRNRELDRYRMLLQAGLLVRVVNSIAVKNSESEQTFKSFVAVAIYIDAEFTAERYLVYQPDTVQPQGEPKSVRMIISQSRVFPAHDILFLLYYRSIMSVINFHFPFLPSHSNFFINSTISPTPYPPSTRTSTVI